MFTSHAIISSFGPNTRSCLIQSALPPGPQGERWSKEFCVWSDDAHNRLVDQLERRVCVKKRVDQDGSALVLLWWQLASWRRIPSRQSACESRPTITHSPWLKSPRYWLWYHGWVCSWCFFSKFAALCWCLPILVGAEVDFPSALSLSSGEAAEKAPEGAESSSRQTRQSAAPESYSFQVTLISSFPNLISPLPEHQNRSRRSKRAPIGCARDWDSESQGRETVQSQRSVPERFRGKLEPRVQHQHQPVPVCTASSLPIQPTKPISVCPASPAGCISVCPASGSLPELSLLLTAHNPTPSWNLPTNQVHDYLWICILHTSYLSFLLHWQDFRKPNFTPKKTTKGTKNTKNVSEKVKYMYEKR